MENLKVYKGGVEKRFKDKRLISNQRESWINFCGEEGNMRGRGLYKEKKQERKSEGGKDSLVSCFIKDIDCNWVFKGIGKKKKTKEKEILEKSFIVW